MEPSGRGEVGGELSGYRGAEWLKGSRVVPAMGSCASGFRYAVRCCSAAVALLRVPCRDGKLSGASAGAFIHRGLNWSK